MKKVLPTSVAVSAVLSVAINTSHIWAHNWDQFIYFPLTNYPEYGYGGRIEKMGG